MATRTRAPRTVKNSFASTRGFGFKSAPVYACECCARRTRYTGEQSLGSKLCPQCWNLAGIENEISDGHVTLDERRAEIARLIAEIESKGGNPRESFAHLLKSLDAPVVVEPVVEAPVVTRTATTVHGAPAVIESYTAGGTAHVTIRRAEAPAVAPTLTVSPAAAEVLGAVARSLGDGATLTITRAQALEIERVGELLVRLAASLLK